MRTKNLNIPDSDLPRVVVIGGGFAGINVCQNLKKAKVQLVLLDKHNYHTFQPLLYQVATSGLEPDSIARSLRDVFRNRRNFFFRLGEVDKVDDQKKCLYTSEGELSYDYLVIATGAITNFFGMDSIEKNAMPMKSIPESLNLRSLILQNFERALLATDANEQKALMTFVLVGGGPTGVELAGALAELRKYILPKDYPDLDIDKMRIVLLEASDQVLAPMSDESSLDAKNALDKLGIEIHLNSQVTGFEGQELRIKNQSSIKAQTVIWAAGVKGAPPDTINADYITKGNRVKVDDSCRVGMNTGIFAIGDVAAIHSVEEGKGHPMLAPVAIQQGQYVGKHITNLTKGLANQPFKYFDKGTMATIGRNKAVVDVAGLHFRGWFAWITWMFVHLFYLIGFRNKIITFINWTWSYIRFDKGFRLIIRPFQDRSKIG